MSTVAVPTYARWTLNIGIFVVNWLVLNVILGMLVGLGAGIMGAEVPDAVTNVATVAGFVAVGIFSFFLRGKIFVQQEGGTAVSGL